MASITGKITGGTTGAPFQSAADEIAKVGGVEEEFLFEGTATQYRLAGRSGTDYPTDGRWEVEPMSQARFRSRLHVLRPGDPDAFNGTVVVVWNNVSVGQDNFTVGAKAARMIEDGFALVGVTTQKVGVDGLPPVDEASEYYGRVMERPPGLKSYDPERYGTLEHPGDGYSYDIYTQAAQLLGPDRPREIDPLDGLRVEHLVSMGGSQSACRQATYFNAIQPITSAFDAYLMLVYAGTPTALDPSTAAARLAEIGENTVDLLAWRTFLLRDDLAVPTIIVNSEFEAEQCYPNSSARHRARPVVGVRRHRPHRAHLARGPGGDGAADAAGHGVVSGVVRAGVARRAACPPALAQRRRTSRAPAPPRPRGRPARTAARRARQRDRRHPAPRPRGAARHPRRREPA